jgi:squalene-hopene/tetraprenyl-beta-curcumene cyclase
MDGQRIKLMKKSPRNQARMFRGASPYCTAISGVLLLGVAMAIPAEQSPPKLELRPEQNVSLRNEVRRAIDKGVAWLDKSQDTNGFWSSADYPAITALGLMAHWSQLGTHEQLIDSEVVRRGYNFLLSCVQPDGGIYRKELPSYNTSVSLVALVLRNRPEYQPLISKARNFIIGLQNLSENGGTTNDAFVGGIGYGKADKRPDLSNTSLALEALYVSQPDVKDKNLPVARDLNWPAAIRFIQSCQNLPSHNPEKWASDDPHNKGGFIYAPGESKAGQTNLPSGRTALRSYGSMSYAGLLSYIYADLKPDDPRVSAVMDWLRANYTIEENPAMGPQGLFYYYHTMAKALTLYGANTLTTSEGQSVNWRERLALKLINLQKADGSWANETGRWFEKDPALVTAYALIALEMIYPKI